MKERHPDQAGRKAREHARSAERERAQRTEGRRYSKPKTPSDQMRTHIEQSREKAGDPEHIARIRQQEAPAGDPDQKLSP